MRSTTREDLFFMPLSPADPLQRLIDSPEAQREVHKVQRAAPIAPPAMTAKTIMTMKIAARRGGLVLLRSDEGDESADD